MDLETFRAYLDHEFLGELNNFQSESNEVHAAAGKESPDSCPHHQVPKERVAVLPTRRGSVRMSKPEFWAAWYVVDLLDQSVHRYARGHEPAWLNFFGKHPIPMVPAGMGCWCPARPELLLKASPGIDQLWTVVCDYIVHDGMDKLREVGVDTGTLILRLLDDNEFNVGHPLERILAERLTALT